MTQRCISPTTPSMSRRASATPISLWKLPPWLPCSPLCRTTSTTCGCAVPVQIPSWAAADGEGLQANTLCAIPQATAAAWGLQAAAVATGRAVQNFPLPGLQDCVQDGQISDAQLELVVYANDRFSQRLDKLPNQPEDMDGAC